MDKKWSSNKKLSMKDDNSNIVEERVVTKASGETTIRKYVKGKQIGKGGFAKCYEFTNCDNK